MGKLQNIVDDQCDKQQELAIHFAYLPKEVREKLLYGDDFVKVPAETLKQLRMDVYPYLM